MTVHIWQKTKAGYERIEDDGYPIAAHLCKICDGYINFLLDGSHECIKCRAVNAPILQVLKDQLDYRARRQAERYDAARTRLDAMIADIPHQRAEDVSESLRTGLLQIGT